MTDSLRRELCVLVKKGDNNQCADCRMKNPTWASFNLGIFICMNCAGCHRSLGTHISRVRSITLDIWDPPSVQNMHRIGNALSNGWYECNIPSNRSLPSHADQNEREVFIREKYERKQWYGDPNQKASASGINGGEKQELSRAEKRAIRQQAKKQQESTPIAQAATATSAYSAQATAAVSATIAPTPVNTSAPAQRTLDLFAGLNTGPSSSPSPIPSVQSSVSSVSSPSPIATPTAAASQQRRVVNNKSPSPWVPAGVAVSNPNTTATISRSISAPSSNANLLDFSGLEVVNSKPAASEPSLDDMFAGMSVSTAPVTNTNPSSLFDSLNQQPAAAAPVSSFSFLSSSPQPSPSNDLFSGLNSSTSTSSTTPSAPSDVFADLMADGGTNHSSMNKTDLFQQSHSAGINAFDHLPIASPSPASNVASLFGNPNGDRRGSFGNKLCAVEGCHEKKVARAYCAKHNSAFPTHPNSLDTGNDLFSGLALGSNHSSNKTPSIVHASYSQSSFSIADFPHSYHPTSTHQSTPTPTLPFTNYPSHHTHNHSHPHSNHHQQGHHTHPTNFLNPTLTSSVTPSSSITAFAPSPPPASAPSKAVDPSLFFPAKKIEEATQDPNDPFAGLSAPEVIEPTRSQPKSSPPAAHTLPPAYPASFNPSPSPSFSSPPPAITTNFPPVSTPRQLLSPTSPFGQGFGDESKNGPSVVAAAPFVPSYAIAPTNSQPSPFMETGGISLFEGYDALPSFNPPVSIPVPASQPSITPSPSVVSPPPSAVSPLPASSPPPPSSQPSQPRENIIDAAALFDGLDMGSSASPFSFIV